eukprot:1110211-Ditylum_brightwellii.AAC.1
MSRITQSSTCGSLNLPLSLACKRCQTNIERAALRGTSSRKVAQYVQPWFVRFKEHSHSTKRARYDKSKDFIFSVSANLQDMSKEEEELQEKEQDVQQEEQEEETQEEEEH